MSDIKLFQIQANKAVELPGEASALERSLQTLIEANLEPMLGIRFLASEHSTGVKHGGRIDTLGIDENGCPVIIEFKRATNENVINQGLFYLDWLMDHKAEFKLLVLEKLGKKHADGILWGQPRLLCIAGGFTKYDEHAVQQMNRNIELIRYKRFGHGLLLFELVNASTAQGGEASKPNSGVRQVYRTFSDSLAELDKTTRDLYEALRDHLVAMGDDVQEKVLKQYVAFKRIKNFACVEVFPSKKLVRIYLKVEPTPGRIEKGFARDVRSIGHFGTGDLEITLSGKEDLERAKSLIQLSYENN